MLQLLLPILDDTAVYIYEQKFTIRTYAGVRLSIEWWHVTLFQQQTELSESESQQPADRSFTPGQWSSRVSIDYSESGPAAYCHLSPAANHMVRSGALNDSSW